MAVFCAKGTRSQGVSSSEKARERLREEEEKKDGGGKKKGEEEKVKQERNEIAVLSSMDFSSISLLPLLLSFFAAQFCCNFVSPALSVGCHETSFPTGTIRVAKI